MTAHARTGHLDALRRRFQAFLWEDRSNPLYLRGPRTVALSLWKFNLDQGFLRASALTYTSLLSLVPLLALAFSILKGLGVQQRLEPLLLEHLAAGNSEVASRILGYVDRTDMSSLGAVGLVSLLLTAVSVLGNVERSMNDIWQVRQGRTYVRKVTDYIALFVVAPVLLLASLSATTTLNSRRVLDALSLLGPGLELLLRAMPLFAIWIAFTAAYLIMPNRRVPLRSAVLAGVAAGTLWHLAEWGYIRFQFGVSRYNAIYGALAQLPILLVWMYTSWCVVLFGAELGFVHQLGGRARGLRGRLVLWAPRLDAVLPLLLCVARRFELGEPTGEQAVLAEAGLEREDGLLIVEHLSRAGLLTRSADDPARVLPARAPDRTSAAELIALALGSPFGADAFGQRVSRALASELGTVTWAELALEGQP